MTQNDILRQQLDSLSIPYATNYVLFKPMSVTCTYSLLFEDLSILYNTSINISYQDLYQFDFISDEYYDFEQLLDVYSYKYFNNLNNIVLDSTGIAPHKNLIKFFLSPTKYTILQFIKEYSLLQNQPIDLVLMFTLKYLTRTLNINLQSKNQSINDTIYSGYQAAGDNLKNNFYDIYDTIITNMPYYYRNENLYTTILDSLSFYFRTNISKVYELILSKQYYYSYINYFKDHQLINTDILTQYNNMFKNYITSKYSDINNIKARYLIPDEQQQLDYIVFKLYDILQDFTHINDANLISTMELSFDVDTYNTLINDLTINTQYVDIKEIFRTVYIRSLFDYIQQNSLSKIATNDNVNIYGIIYVMIKLIEYIVDNIDYSNLSFVLLDEDEYKVSIVNSTIRSAVSMYIDKYKQALIEQFIATLLLRTSVKGYRT